jgi:hypothetical protein
MPFSRESDAIFANNTMEFVSPIVYESVPFFLESESDNGYDTSEDEEYWNSPDYVYPGAEPLVGSYQGNLRSRAPQPISEVIMILDEEMSSGDEDSVYCTSDNEMIVID